MSWIVESHRQMKKMISIIRLVAAVILSVVVVWDTAFALNPMYNVIINKNPFDPKRGKGEMNSTVSSFNNSQGDIAEKFVVYGVVVVGDDKIAYLADLKGPVDEYRTVRINDLVEGWTVKDIDYNRVVFEKNGQTVALPIFDQKKKERSVNKPVAFATPKMTYEKSRSNQKATTSKERAKKTKTFKGPFNFKPNNVNNGANNPFLKAIQDAQKKGLTGQPLLRPGN